MVSEEREALDRLAARLGSRTATVWLRDARVEFRGPNAVLRVRGRFQRRWLEDRNGVLREVFGRAVLVVDDQPAPAPPRPRAMPRLRGLSGDFAHRMVRAFVEGGPASSPLTVVYGPEASGKSVLVDWACAAGRDAVFRVDLLRLRSGRSRGLVPRKPLVVAAGVEILAGRDRAQRTLCTIVDAVRDRGHRLLCSLQGHPAERDGLYPALRNRLLGGVLIPVEAEDPAMVAAWREGRRPGGAPAAAPAPPPVDALTRMKDEAARLFSVERALLDGGTKRRRVVEARRAVIAAACRGGLAPESVAAAFGLRSPRAVREACRWAAREADRDGRFATMLHEVGRVLGTP